MEALKILNKAISMLNYKYECLIDKHSEEDEEILYKILQLEIVKDDLI